MNNDLIARRLKPPTPPAAPLQPSAGHRPAMPPPYAPQSPTPDRSAIPWDRPEEPVTSAEAEPEATATAESGETAEAAEDVYRVSPESELFELAADPEEPGESAFDPDPEFVSYAPPWDRPPDVLWPPDPWEATVRESAPEPEPAAEVELDESAATEDPIVAHTAAVDRSDLQPATELEVVQPEAEAEAEADAEASDMADPDDALAPIAGDLVLSAERSQEIPAVWPERDLVANRVVAHDAGDSNVFEPLVGHAADDEGEPTTETPDLEPVHAAWDSPDLEAAPSVFGTPEPDQPSSDQPLTWPTASGGSSVFGDLFVTARPMPPPDFENAMAEHVSPVEWPPVPTGVFPPLPHLLPTLNVEPPADAELEIAWPDDPRPQTFWPNSRLASEEAEAEAEADVGSWSPNTAANHDPVPAPALGPRLIPPPSRPLRPTAIPDPMNDRPMLVFSDPVPASVARDDDDARDGPLARFASQATALADRIPDHWSLAAPPTLTSTTDDAVAHDLSDIQSPVLTVLFAIIAIAAVLFFIYVVTPLLR